MYFPGYARGICQQPLPSLFTAPVTIGSPFIRATAAPMSARKSRTTQPSGTFPADFPVLWMYKNYHLKEKGEIPLPDFPLLSDITVCSLFSRIDDQGIHIVFLQLFPALQPGQFHHEYHLHHLAAQLLHQLCRGFR